VGVGLLPPVGVLSWVGRVFASENGKCQVFGVFVNISGIVKMG
jgi:hypothetical protein